MPFAIVLLLPQRAARCACAPGDVGIRLSLHACLNGHHRDASLRLRCAYIIELQSLPRRAFFFFFLRILCADCLPLSLLLQIIVAADEDAQSESLVIHTFPRYKSP